MWGLEGELAPQILKKFEEIITESTQFWVISEHFCKNQKRTKKMSENQKYHQKIIETKNFTKEQNLSILVPLSPRLASLKRNDVIDERVFIG